MGVFRPFITSTSTMSTSDQLRERVPDHQHFEQARTDSSNRVQQVGHEMNLREQIRQDASFSGTYGGTYAGQPQPFGSVPLQGHPASLQDLGFGRGRYAEELSQLRYRSGAERGVFTAAEESEKLLERYRRERHIFTPMREEIAHRSNHESKILEPVKSVATRVAEQRKIEERLVHRSYNPYFAGTLPANAMGYHGGEMRLAHEKCTQDELSTFARARAVEGDGSHIGNCDMRAEEDALRHRNVLSPTKEGMREAFAHRY